MHNRTPEWTSAMTSEAQRHANGCNANKSTGPRSSAGKTKSSQNAVKHGVYATRDLPIRRGAFTEDPDEVAEFFDDIIASLEPRDPIQLEEAGNIARIYLRLRRVARLEAESIAGRDEPLSGPANPDDPASVQAYEDRLARERGIGALGHLRQVLELTSRIDSRNSLALERAMKRYANLRKRVSED
jgi:hypothetical protein